MATYTKENLREIFEAGRHRARAWCKSVRPIAGGQPATDDALAAFIEHYLGIPPESDDFDETFKRIKEREINLTPAEGELIDSGVYAVNMFRRSEHGPWIGDWMIKACLKVAASKLGYFVKVKGSKGDMAELGVVRAIDSSLQNPNRPWEVHVRMNGGPAPTTYKEMLGTVSTPQGRKSISHHTEFVGEGAEFAFEFSHPGKLDEKQIVEAFSLIGTIGLGSCRSFQYGGFEVERLEIL